MSETALKIININKSYLKKVALKNINLEILKGDFFALLGANGAGKTTLIGILTDLVKKNSGKIEVFGLDQETNLNDTKRMIGVVPQEFNLPIFSKAFDVVVNQAGYYGIEKKVAVERTSKLFDELGLGDKKDSRVNQLSGGMKRRLMIARALVHNPKILILDEPTAGVDINLRKLTYEFLEKINSEGTTIILTTHYLEEVDKLCNKLAFIHDSEIVVNMTKKDFMKTANSKFFEVEILENFEINNLNKEINISKIGENNYEIEVSANFKINQIIEEFAKVGAKINDIKNISNNIEMLFEKFK